MDPGPASPLMPSIQGFFVPTKLDALLLIEACLCGRIEHWSVYPRNRSLVIADGAIFIFMANAACDYQLDDNLVWDELDHDGFFEISQSRHNPGFLKKEMEIWVEGHSFRLISYYNNWNFLESLSVPPTHSPQFLDLLIREELVALDVGYTPKAEKLRAYIGMSLSDEQKVSLTSKVCFCYRFYGLTDTFQSMPPMHLVALQTVVFLVVCWTEESAHKDLIIRFQWGLLPFIPEKWVYWHTLTQECPFEGNTGDELARQMYLLLCRLFWISSGQERVLPRPLEPSNKFTPLQNVCLLAHAFDIAHAPIGAFQPLDVPKVRRTLDKLHGMKLFPNMDTQDIERMAWELRVLLPINCPPPTPVRISILQKERELTFHRTSRYVLRMQRVT